MELFKKYFWTLLDLLLVMVIILIISSVSALHHYVDSSPSSRNITVSAEGKTVTIPDIAKINFSVVTEGIDTVKISSENAEKMDKAVNFIKSEGIEAKDIQTAGYDLSPKYEYDKEKRKSFISGYTLTQTVYLKIRDFSKISKILGTLPELGVNDISSLVFEVENQDKFLNDARNQAFEKALAKAKTMADKNGVKIKRVVTFTEYQSNHPIYAMEKFGMGGGDAAPSVVPAIEPGSQEITVNVSVTYEIN